MGRIVASAAALLLLMGADGGNSVDLVALIREFGFPIFVCVWFMWRLEKRLEELRDSIEELVKQHAVMNNTLNNLSDGSAPPGGV
jgi:hypothetical protein